MGYLKHQQGALAGEAMRAEVAAESRRQAELAACDCLEEDKKLLAQLYHRRGMQNIRRIAREHGVLDSATFTQQTAGDNVSEDE
jgi:transposase-like protein